MILSDYFWPTNRISIIAYLRNLFFIIFLSVCILRIIDFLEGFISNTFLLVLSALVIIACFVVFLRQVVSRFHDFNFSGWWIIFICLWIGGVAYAVSKYTTLFDNIQIDLFIGEQIFNTVLLMGAIIPGSNKENKFGSIPNRNYGWLDYILALIFVFLVSFRMIYLYTI